MFSMARGASLDELDERGALTLSSRPAYREFLLCRTPT